MIRDLVANDYLIENEPGTGVGNWRERLRKILDE
jgi:hypothetical protein